MKSGSLEMQERPPSVPWPYTLAVHALLPWAVLHLLWRSRKQPAYRQHWGERFARYAAAPTRHAKTADAVPPAPTFPSLPTIWIHAVSVGETRAAQPLVAALRQRYPEHRILMTHMTPTGRDTSAALFGDTVERVYLPYDTPWAMRRFLAHFQPVLGIIMETELWPNLIAACHARNISLLLVNARLSEKSARRYARFPALTRNALRQLSAIAAISAADAVRLTALGASGVEVFGNVKFDSAAPAGLPDLRRLIGARPVFLCASTREGEEALILDAWQKVGTGGMQCPAAGAAKEVLLVIVPRHPQRFDEVARLVETRGLALQRRSDEQAVAATTQVWLGDSMGELFAYYVAASDRGVAFVGGSLLDFGCQNLIEPCAAGTPVLIGPSTFNFAEAAQGALAAGAARPVESANVLVATAVALLGDAERRRAMGEAGRQFAAQHRGATAKTLALIARFRPPGTPYSPTSV